METIKELSEDHLKMIEDLLDVPRTRWEVTDRETTTNDSDEIRDLVIVNAKVGYETEMRNVRGVVIDLESSEIVLRRFHHQIYVQDDLVGEERDVDPVADISRSYEDIGDRFCSILAEYKDIAKIDDKTVKKFNTLAKGYIEGFILKSSFTEEEIIKKMEPAYKKFESIGKKIVEIANNDGGKYSDAARCILIPLLMDVSHSPAYILNFGDEFVYEKCCTETGNSVKNVIDIQKIVPEVLAKEAQQHSAQDPLMDVIFPAYYRKLLNCRNRRQISTANEDFLAKIPQTPLTEAVINVFSYRVFNENVLFRLRKREERKYFPIFEGYSFTLFKYKDVKNIVTHRKFKEFDGKIILATNASVVKEGVIEALEDEGKTEEQIAKILPSFEKIPMRNGDSVKFMHISEEFIMGSKVSLGEKIAYCFEENFRSASGRKVLQNYRTLSDYERSPESARSYLQNGVDNTGEALYVKSSDGDFKIYSHAYDKRHKIFSRNIAVDGDYTRCLASNFMLAYYKTNNKGLTEEEEANEIRRSKEIFVNEFPPIKPASTQIVRSNVATVKNLVPLKKEEMKYLKNFQFRIAVVYTTMLYYCHEKRRPHLINSMRNLIEETDKLIESIDNRNTLLFQYSPRAKAISSLRQAKAESKGKYQKEYKASCRLLIAKENPFSLLKMIRSNQNASKALM